MDLNAVASKSFIYLNIFTSMHALLIVDEILANRAQEYPCIYDKSDKDHRRQSITSSLWKKDTHKVKVLSLSLLIVLYTLQLRKYSQFCLDFVFDYFL